MGTRTRGPLKASYDKGIVSKLASDIRKTGDGTGMDYASEAHDLSSTPLLRALVRSRRSNRPSVSQNYTSPVRASSYRSDKTSSVEDIRQHFPIRISSVRCVEFGREDDSSSLYSGRNCAKRPMEFVSETNSGNQYKRCRGANTAFSPAEQKPILTMGAFVKAHPRYYRRRSGTDPTPLDDQHQIPIETRRTSSAGRLSPICPVPMPDNFPAKLPNSCTIVSLPWEAEHGNCFARVSQCNTETQTSPPSDPIRTGHMLKTKKHFRSNRRSSGSTQVLEGLRKTFGHLRRAISAERLQRSMRTPDTKKGTHFSRNVESVRLGPSRSSKSKFPSFSTSGLGQRLSADHTVACERNVAETQTSHLPDSDRKVENENAASAIRMVESSENCDMPKSTCYVTRKYPDGSFQVVLRRASTLHQFGFFIARDAQGIHISRLGSVRCAVKFWDVFHVGDRILEVQGVPCQQLTVDDVQNLIRGCELVEFRIRSARSSQVVD